MQRTIILIVVLLIALPLFSQNLKDNPDYQESLKYQQLSEEALEEGEYLQATEYAELSAEYARKSDQYVTMMLAKYRANQLLRRADSLRSEVERSGRSTEDPAVFARAAALIESARGLYTGEQFSRSSDASRNAISLLEETFGGARTVTSNLPAAYVVRRLPGAEDCMWRIASYEFVYGDAAAWRPIYEANKNKFPEPNNPNLILPDMVLTIPERAGETRSGVWVDGEIRATAP